MNNEALTIALEEYKVLKLDINIYMASVNTIQTISFTAIPAAMAFALQQLPKNPHITALIFSAFIPLIGVVYAQLMAYRWLSLMLISDYLSIIVEPRLNMLSKAKKISVETEDGDSIEIFRDMSIGFENWLRSKAQKKIVNYSHVFVHYSGPLMMSILLIMSALFGAALLWGNMVAKIIRPYTFLFKGQRMSILMPFRYTVQILSVGLIIYGVLLILITTQVGRISLPELKQRLTTGSHLESKAKNRDKIKN